MEKTETNQSMIFCFRFFSFRIIETNENMDVILFFLYVKNGKNFNQKWINIFFYFIFDDTATVYGISLYSHLKVLCTLYL